MSVTEVIEEKVETDKGVQDNIAWDYRENDDMSLRDMLDNLGADKDIQVKVIRTQPKKWKGVSIEGHLDTYEEMQSEEELKAMYGGGTYQLKVFRPDGKGSMRYFKAASIKVSGEPKLPGEKEEVQAFIPSGPTEDAGAVSQAMSTMEKLLSDMRNDKQQSNGMDLPAMMAMVGTMMEPLKANLAQAQAQAVEAQRLAAEKDAHILQLIGTKPDNSENDKLVHKMFDTESNRSDHLRQMHESEMRQLRENTIADAKRADDRHRDELRAREDMQRREVDSITRSNDQVVTTLRMSYDSRIEGYKKDIERVERDLSEARTELIALRAKKDKPLMEQVGEITQMKEAFEAITGGGGKDDDDRKWYEKVLGQALENPESLGAVFSMATGQNPAQQQQQLAQAPQAPPQQQLAPVAAPQEAEGNTEIHNVDDIPMSQPFQDENGDVYIKVPPNGDIMPYDDAVALAKAAQAKDQELESKGIEKPSASDVKMAIRFMESAFTAGTSSVAFAQSAKSMIPNNILKYMESVGIDAFLNEVAVLEQGSPLRNQAGRGYIKEVARFLLEGIPG